nr:MAG TPA: hypothetical protein [Caudoviricetes sp.]
MYNTGGRENLSPSFIFFCKNIPIRVKLLWGIIFLVFN